MVWVLGRSAPWWSSKVGFHVLLSKALLGSIQCQCFSPCGCDASRNFVLDKWSWRQQTPRMHSVVTKTPGEYVCVHRRQISLRIRRKMLSSAHDSEIVAAAFSYLISAVSLQELTREIHFLKEIYHVHSQLCIFSGTL